ncbi:MAG: hypothetical protein KBF83_13115 [Pyrinomonadaceae bacterium]|nr:hypothetical protein [Pyrinomonadaceae bacterium]
MRNCSTCFPHSTPLNSGVPQTRSDENLASVEQVLGVLIDSRFGPNHPYTRLGEQHERRAIRRRSRTSHCSQ